MKRTMILIALAWLQFIPISTSAQTVQASEIDFYSTDIGDNAIIRTDFNHGGSMISYETQDGNINFLYRLTDGTTRRFSWPSATMSHKYEIYDMVIGEGYCYFCGSYILGLTSNNPVLNGMVGCIDLSYITNTPCSTAYATINTHVIPNRKKFTQMDIQYCRGPAKLCLVGENHSLTKPSCAAFMEWDGNDWSYRIVDVADSGEMLTDIAFSGSGNKVVAVSRFANEPYKFGLRGEYTSTLFDFTLLPTLTNFTHRNTVNTYGLYLASSSNPHPTWHENDIIAQIICHPNSEEFTVAYECVDNTKVCETQRQVALFRIDVSTFPGNYNMNVTGKQMVHGYFEGGSTFTDMMYIPDNKTIALLHKSPNSTKEKSSAVQFPSWLAYGQINSLISDSTLHSSMDIRHDNNNPYITLIGNNESVNTICYFLQRLDFLEASCYQTRPVSISEELLGNDWSVDLGITNIENNFQHDRHLGININCIEVPQDTPCSSFHLQ